MEKPAIMERIRNGETFSLHPEEIKLFLPENKISLLLFMQTHQRYLGVHDPVITVIGYMDIAENISVHDCVLQVAKIYSYLLNPGSDQSYYTREFITEDNRIGDLPSTGKIKINVYKKKPFVAYDVSSEPEELPFLSGRVFLLPDPPKR